MNLRIFEKLAEKPAPVQQEKSPLNVLVKITDKAGVALAWAFGVVAVCVSVAAVLITFLKKDERKEP